MIPAKLEFARAIRERVKAINPDFALIGETMLPEAREVLDGYYPSRYRNEHDRIYRYMFPELRQQAVLVGNYAYDAVNKALALGIGAETECWGLRTTALDGCPELARYLGQVNAFKRRYADVMIRGTFRDTVGATVRGECLYSVLDGPGRSRALVLRNPHDRPAEAIAALPHAAGQRLILWRPFEGERSIRALPLRLRLKPYEAAVLGCMTEVAKGPGRKTGGRGDR